MERAGVNACLCVSSVCVPVSLLGCIICDYEIGSGFAPHRTSD